MPRALVLLTFFVMGLLVTGCGQSGPLYVPGNPSQMTVPPTDTSTRSAGGEDEEESSDSVNRP